MLTTPIHGLPYAESEDPVREYPATVDGPKTLQLDTLLGNAVRDTGLRDITSLLINGWTGSVFIRRAGSFVIVYLNQANVPSGGAAVLIATAPVGFEPASAISAYGPMYNITTGGVTGVVYNHSTAFVRVNVNPTAGSQIRSSYMFSTNAAWPAILPGVPV